MLLQCSSKLGNNQETCEARQSVIILTYHILYIYIRAAEVGRRPHELVVFSETMVSEPQK